MATDSAVNKWSEVFTIWPEPVQSGRPLPFPALSSLPSPRDIPLTHTPCRCNLDRRDDRSLCPIGDPIASEGGRGRAEAVNRRIEDGGDDGEGGKKTI